MDKNEKLALARKKLRKFQAKSSTPNSVHTFSTETNGYSGPNPKSVRFDDEGGTNHVQVHSQSIDILVAEKTYLIDKLSTTETELNMKKKECSSLQDDLRILRQQVDETQKEKNRLVTEINEKNKSLTQNSTTDREMKSSLHRTQTSLEELRQENSELLSRVTSQTKELHQLTQLKEELQSKLTMQEILTQQLQSSSQPSTPLGGGGEKIEELEEKVTRLSANLQSLKREKDQSLSDVTALREALLNTQQENARKVGDLQTQLKQSAIEMSSLKQHLTKTMSTDNNEEKYRILQQSLQLVQNEKESLKTQLEHLTADNGHLSQLHANAEDTIISLEGEVSRLRGEVVDQQSLMTTISHDKETISRTATQNKDLKEQLSELQEAYVQKSNQNMDLASSLDSEKHKNHWMQHKQGEMEIEIRDLKTHVEELSRELESKMKNEEQLEKKELLQTSENISEESHTHDDGSQSHTYDESHSHTYNDESHIQELSIECASLREERDKLLEELKRLSSPSPSSAMELQDDISIENSSILQHSFSALQDRFTALMSEKADLLDKLQECEHVIIQLSGENETIGEYVSLYQTQREALKMKFIEKDRHIEQLVQEKVNMQLKLREVQSMVAQLGEPLPSAILPPHIRPSSNIKDKRAVSDIVTLIEDELSSTGSTIAHCPCCSGQLIIV